MKNRPFTELSGGEKQRVIIAMALAQEPRIILMDEATANLDINHKLEVMQIVERLHSEKNVTVLMVSHDLNLMAEFCQRLLLMNHGKLVAGGKPEDVLKEDILRQVYHCDVRVQQNSANNSVSVVPAPRLTTGISGKGTKVHVISGGGCGEELLRRLSLCEFTVTCGVLNQQDSDAEVAAALDLETVLERPFSPISNKAFEAAKKMIHNAEIVIVGNVPFGPGNVINLELAELALQNGKRVLIMDNIESRDYTPDKSAAKKVDQLIKNGAIVYRNITDLFNRMG
jgi:iron complex transport system ATP-binding protein